MCNIRIIVLTVISWLCFGDNPHDVLAIQVQILGISHPTKSFLFVFSSVSRVVILVSVLLTLQFSNVGVFNHVSHYLRIFQMPT